MPRADPSRSDYCATRHLLRNLDAPAELRRNPLARDYFAAAGASRRRDAAADRHALDRVRRTVRTSLARCTDHTVARTSVNLGRMHAALLRCDIDDQPMPVVAAELGLSERQLRRERRAAHVAFVRAFREAERETPPPAAAYDVAGVRIAQAVELHELGQTALALSAFASIASHAPSPERRIEALCLAAEAELDAVRHPAAAAHAAEARAILALHGSALDEPARRTATEHVELVDWLLRWQTGLSGGLATPLPLALALRGEDDQRDERGRALFVRAVCAYAAQRFEIGDAAGGRNALRRAHAVLPSLDATRTKERLGLMYADAQFVGLRAPGGADLAHFAALEELAAARGHVRVMLAARVERIGSETLLRPRGTDRVFDAMLHPFGAHERRCFGRTFAWSAAIVSQCESDARRVLAAALLTESLVPARSATSLMARCCRAGAVRAAGRYDEAWSILHDVRADAKLVGNGRLHGAAARLLASIELGRRRTREAQHWIREALPLLEHYGTYVSLEHANALARRLDVA